MSQHHHNGTTTPTMASNNNNNPTASTTSSSPSHTSTSNSSSSNTTMLLLTTAIAGERHINGPLIWPILIRPLLCKIQKRSPHAAFALFNALGKAENAEPGFLLELIAHLILAANDGRIGNNNRNSGGGGGVGSSSSTTIVVDLSKTAFNMTESLLRLQAYVPEFDDQRCHRMEDPFQELNRRTFALKKILSRIPDEIYDRKLFLETIKEIASAIKKLLDCVNDITTPISGGSTTSSPSSSTSSNTSNPNSTSTSTTTTVSYQYLKSHADRRAIESRKRDFIKDSKNFSQTLKEYFKGGNQQMVFNSAAQLIGAINFIQKTIKSRCDPNSQQQQQVLRVRQQQQQQQQQQQK